MTTLLGRRVVHGPTLDRDRRKAARRDVAEVPAA
jgi:hypothetical protein